MWDDRFKDDRVGLIAIAGTATAATAAPPSGGGDLPSSIGILFTDDPGGDDVFVGSVSSSEPLCERNRRVSVYRKKRKRAKKVGSTITGNQFSESAWEVFKEDPKDGKYYAKVAAERIGARTTCEEAKSPKIRVDDDPAV